MGLEELNLCMWRVGFQATHDHRRRSYHGGAQWVWPLRRLTCVDTKMASPYLIAPVIYGLSPHSHAFTNAVLTPASPATSLILQPEIVTWLVRERRGAASVQGDHR